MTIETLEKVETPEIEVTDELRKEVFDKISTAGINNVINELGMDPNIILKNWTDAKKDKEGIIVKISDLASVVYKLWDETILLGKVMKLNPFDQPEVELIKKETKKILV